jgi:predicted amidophosphoribosyltransferase
MVSKKNGKRLAQYLENELGWEVVSSVESICPACAKPAGSFRNAVFCDACGTKLVKSRNETDEVYQDLASAIRYAMSDRKQPKGWMI